MATFLNPLLYALGGYLFGKMFVLVFPFAGVWVAGGLRKFGFEIQPADLPTVFAIFCGGFGIGGLF